MPAKIKDRYRTFEAKPAVSGALVTRGSADNAGIFNYTTKRDFRRDLDIERRREGYDYFYPNLTLPVGGQPFPSQLQLDSLTFAAGVVTATRLMGHWFDDSEIIQITGANQPAYNGTFLIYNVTETSFQYSIPGAPASPDTSTAIFATAHEPITLIDSFERPNGQFAVVAGSPRRLYRYVALDDPDYISRDPADYPLGTAPDQLSYWSDGTLFPADAAQYPPATPLTQQQYVDTNPGYWIVIGAGFDPNANRWEAVPINGYMVFNNSSDLPVTYRVEETFTVPIYELREQGIAAVGTISEINGILMCADLSEIHSDALVDWMKQNHYSPVATITNNGSGLATAIVPGGHTFKVRQNVVIRGAVSPFLNGTFRVVAVPSQTTFQYRINGVPASPDPSAGIYASGDPYQRYTDQATLDRTQFRVGWAVPDEPRRWALEVPGFMTAGSNQLLLQFPVKGFFVGEDIIITGAGAPHAGGTSDNLSAKIIFIDDRTLILNAFAQTTVSLAPVVAADSIGSIVGFENLQDSGSGILKMLPLADQLVIYKADSIFLAQYLGSPAQPFAFSPREVDAEGCLYYRNTLILAETSTEEFHIYAGPNDFFRFDLTSQQPMLLAHFESCSDIFYSQANLANTEQIFSCKNGLTMEILFVFPSNTSEKALIWDFKQDTISTTGVVMTAGATVPKPLAGPLFGSDEDWFLMGNSSSTIVQYGLATNPQTYWGQAKAIYYQRGQCPFNPARGGYPSFLQYGLGNFGNDFGEKDVRALVPLMDSTSPNTPFSMNLYRTQNANMPMTVIGTKNFTNPLTQNLFPCGVRGMYFSTGITVNGMDNPFGWVGVVWNVAPVDSRSATRG